MTKPDNRLSKRAVTAQVASNRMKEPNSRSIRRKRCMLKFEQIAGELALACDGDAMHVIPFTREVGEELLAMKKVEEYRRFFRCLAYEFKPSMTRLDVRDVRILRTWLKKCSFAEMHSSLEQYFKPSSDQDAE